MMSFPQISTLADLLITMHFHKYPHPANFEFSAAALPGASFATACGHYRMRSEVSHAGIHHLQVTGKSWRQNDSDAGLAFESVGPSAAPTSISVRDGKFHWTDGDGNLLISAQAGRFFGQCGESWMFEFELQAGDRFYGFGEKWTGFEHSDRTHKFWNTDVWGDFHSESFTSYKPAPDPVYVSVPYAILKRGNTYVGLLIDNPHATFISVNNKTSIAGQMDLESGRKLLHLGAEQGQPNLFLICGPSLPELTRKLQILVGTTPLPPAWALGYHQCRWGYQSASDLEELDKQFDAHGIPADGLWLDIDYMEGYRVFTFEKKHFPNPANSIKELAKRGRKVIPIIDPGVKNEPGYGVFDRGVSAGAFCQNPQGRNFVGLVWPGETVFPDFSIEEARQWWAKEVEAFANNGIPGAWLDMNDPATGQVENSDMLFDSGRKSHSSYHNQYALGMAKATRDGFLAAHPKERPFLLSRSGCTGTSRYAAIWTGDNFSNYHHLKNCIPTTLNLALSGIPFNGPDVGGYGGDASPELIRDWFKAGFLFPFFRNHTILNSRKQEPWAFDKKTLGIVSRYIRLRYRLRPYLYQLFVEQERTGEAILRPLFYDFEDSAAMPLGDIDDQFLVGPSVMQAPFVVEGQARRNVVLPGGQRWFASADGCWLDGGQSLEVEAAAADTPLYIRDGSILPLARLEHSSHAFDSSRIDFHIFLSGDGNVSTHYTFDDGISFAYLEGKRSEVRITATRIGTAIEISVESLSDGYGLGDFTFSTESSIRKITVNGTPASRLPEQGVRLCSRPMRTWAVKETAVAGG